METFNAPLWDLSQPASFSQMPDDDFLALLQKQFPPSDGQNDFTFLPPTPGFGVNPQNLNSMSLPTLTPPSDDSSPSPPDHNGSRRSITVDDDEEPTDKKRKANDDDFEEGPSSKSQHTAPKKGAASSNKRKTSTGNSDETRLLKRKEQNRAAQRAFRERKEKHVKDLEDKVAALEAKNTATESENENLKDLLTRLQNENMALRRSSFTFTVPKSGSTSTPGSTGDSPSQFSAMSPQSSPFISMPSTTKLTNPLDLSSLTAFDPNVLNLLDEPSASQQPTATSTSNDMGSNFGFGKENSGYFTQNFTTIASNPMFLSLASIFEDPMPSSSTSPPLAANNTSSRPDSSTPNASTTSSAYDFDMGSLSAWPSSALPNNGSTSIDDLFSQYLSPSNQGYSSPSSTSLSPIIHQTTPSSLQNQNYSGNITMNGITRSPSSASSSSMSNSASPESHQSEASTSATSSGSVVEETHHKPDLSQMNDCPKTKAEFVKKLGEDQSPFAPLTSNSNNTQQQGGGLSGLMDMSMLQHIGGMNGMGNINGLTGSVFNGHDQQMQQQQQQQQQLQSGMGMNMGLMGPPSSFPNNTNTSNGWNLGNLMGSGHRLPYGPMAGGDMSGNVAMINFLNLMSMTGQHPGSNGQGINGMGGMGSSPQQNFAQSQSPPQSQAQSQPQQMQMQLHQPMNKPSPPSVSCQSSSSFPTTEQNEKNIEVLNAWKAVTSHPAAKDADIHELCTQFSQKAKCDGTKLVIEPDGIENILETLSQKKASLNAAASAAGMAI